MCKHLFSLEVGQAVEFRADAEVLRVKGKQSVVKGGNDNRIKWRYKLN